MELSGHTTGRRGRWDTASRRSATRVARAVLRGMWCLFQPLKNLFVQALFPPNSNTNTNTTLKRYVSPAVPTPCSPVHRPRGPAPCTCLGGGGVVAFVVLAMLHAFSSATSALGQRRALSVGGRGLLLTLCCSLSRFLSCHHATSSLASAQHRTASNKRRRVHTAFRSKGASFEARPEDEESRSASPPPSYVPPTPAVALSTSHGVQLSHGGGWGGVRAPPYPPSPPPT